MTKYKVSVREDLCTETVTRTHWNCQEQGGTGLFHSSLCQMKFVDQSLLQGITPAVAAIARGMYLESILVMHTAAVHMQPCLSSASLCAAASFLWKSFETRVTSCFHDFLPNPVCWQKTFFLDHMHFQRLSFFSGLMTLKQQTPNAGSVPTFSSKPRSRPNEIESFQYMSSGEA